MNFVNINGKSISNIFIGISFIVTSIVISIPELYLYGINSYFYDKGIYSIFIIQLFSGVFMHGGLLHLLANSIFLLLFGNVVENIIGKKNFIIFFIITVLSSGISLLLFTNGTTVGISGFAMALLGFFTVYLFRSNNPDYKGGITAIIINIAIGLAPGISLIGHLTGAIVGIIYGLLYKNKKH